MHPEDLQRRFDQWEERTRGLTPRRRRVSLEPKYSPLFGRRRVVTDVIDDARKPGLFAPKHESRAERPKPNLSAIPKPVSHQGSGELVELQIALRQDFSAPIETAGALLKSFSGLSHHVSFELVASPDRIVQQLTCDVADRSAVRASLRAYLPDAQILEQQDYLKDAWQSQDGFGAMLAFGLKDRVFRMLRTDERRDLDALIEGIGKLDDLAASELALVQILFCPTVAPWGQDFEQFVSHIDDVDRVLPLIKNKFSEPTFAVALRVAAIAPTEAAASARVRGLAGAITNVTRSDANEFVLLNSAKHSFEDEVADVLDRQAHRRGALLSLSELATLVHPPSASVRSPRLVRASGRTKAAPAIVAGHAFVLGINDRDGQERSVSLSTDQRLRHIHVVGASGSGKSTLLLSMAMQDIEAGNGFAVLDPHGDLIEEVLARIPEHRVKDVVFFDPADDAYPVGFNVLSAHSELEKTLLASDFVGIFRRLSSTTFGDQMVSVLGNAVLAFLESTHGGTLLDLRHFLTEKNFRTRFLKSVADPEVVYYWEHEFPLVKGMPHASILTRLNTFLRPKVLRYMVAQRRDRLDFRAIMDGKKILLAKLSHGMIGEENAHLLGSLLVAKIAQATMSRQDEEAAKRMPFTLYIDEFQNFVTPSVAAVLSGARKYALGLCLAHHEMRQLKSRSEDVASAVLANAYTRIVFQVGDADARSLAEGFSYFQSADLQNLGIGHAVARVERSDFDFNLRTLLPPKIEPALAVARRNAVLSASRASYATPRAEVEAVLAATHEPSPPTRDSAPAPVPPPKPEAPHLPGRGGAQHKYLQDLIRRLAEERGFTVSIEKEVLDGHGYVDVALERDGLSVACEISISTRLSHELTNLTKCLSAGFAYVALVSSNPRLLKNARASMEADTRLYFLMPNDLAQFLDELTGISPRISEAPPKTEKKGNQGRILVGAGETPSDMKHMLDTIQAGEYLGLAVQTLAQMRVSGDSPPFHKLGRRVLYNRADLDIWIAERKRRSTSDTGARIPAPKNPRRL